MIATWKAQGDGRYYVFPANGDDAVAQLSEGLETSFTGQLRAELPLYFPTSSVPLGGTDDDLNGDGLPDNTLLIEVSDLSSFRESLTTTVPDFKSTIGLESLLNNLDIVTLIAGAEDDQGDPLLRGVLGNLQALLDSRVFGNIELPFLGGRP